MFTATPGGRVSAAGVRIELGLAAFTVDLQSVFTSSDDDDATAMTVSCPHESHGGRGVGAVQQYVCAENLTHGPYQLGELGRRTENADGVSIAVDPDKVRAIKTGDLEKKHLALRVYPADEVAAAVRPGEKGYLVRPAKGKRKVIEPSTEAAYNVLLTYVAAHPEVALVGDLIVKTTRSTYRLEMYGEQLFLQELVLPANLRERDDVDLDEPDPRLVGQLTQLAEVSLETFDVTNHTWDVADAMAELKARATAAAAPADPATPAVPIFDDATIDAALDAAIAARLAASGISV